MALVSVKFNAEKITAKINKAKDELPGKIDKILSANTIAIAKQAKINIQPNVNSGYLINHIAPDISKFLEKRVTVNAFYAPYVEFGTGKYAAQYVSTLPDDWRTYAAKFKGHANRGNFEDFLQAIIQWVHDKQLAGTYSVKTRRRTGNKGKHLFEDAELAYIIAIAIIRNGIHPHPFLYPAYNAQRAIIKENIRTYIKSLLK